MKNLFTPVLLVAILMAMLIIGITSQAFALVLLSCGAWNPAMLWVGYQFAQKGLTTRAVFLPIGILMGLGVLITIGLATSIIPLMIIGCGGIIPALIFAGWSLAQSGDDGEMVGDKPLSLPIPTSTILTADEIKRGLAQLEKRKLAHLTNNGNGEFK